MTHPRILTSILAAVAFTALGGTTRAQNQIQRAPVVSPYLNLLRGGNPAYLNYYGLVQPQLQTQRDLSTLQNQVGGLNSALNSAVGAGQGSDLQTGHPFGFSTHRGYFLNALGGGGGGGYGNGSNGNGSNGSGGYGGGNGFGRNNVGSTGVGGGFNTVNGLGTTGNAIR